MKMSNFPAINIVLLLFACDSVHGAAGGFGNLTIIVTKTNYKAKIPGIKLKTYEFELDDTLELKCGGSEPLFLKWTDSKNKIYEESGSETKDFTLKLEKLKENDNQNNFVCKSKDAYATIRLVLKNITDLRKLQKNNSEVCYEFVKESNKNCSHNLRQEVIRRVQTPCPKEMTQVSNNDKNTENYDTNDSVDILGEESLSEDETGSLLYVGVSVFGFIAFAIITIFIFKCYKKVKERKYNEHIYAEPNAVVYAELQVKNDTPPKLPNRLEPPYAKIIGILTPE